MFFGGLSIKKDEEVLKKECPHVVVGTPGRILALIRNKTLNLRHIKHFILDECDKMLEQLGESESLKIGQHNTTDESSTLIYILGDLTTFTNKKTKPLPFSLRHAQRRPGDIPSDPP